MNIGSFARFHEFEVIDRYPGILNGRELLENVAYFVTFCSNVYNAIVSTNVIENLDEIQYHNVMTLAELQPRYAGNVAKYLILENCVVLRYNAGIFIMQSVEHFDRAVLE